MTEIEESLEDAIMCLNSLATFSSPMWVAPIESISTEFKRADSFTSRLLRELKDCTFRGVGGFHDKFFDPKSWCKEQNAMLEGILTAHDGKMSTNFPTSPDNEKPVWDWLRSLQDGFLKGAPNKFHTAVTDKHFEDGNVQLSLVVQKSSRKNEQYIRIQGRARCRASNTIA
ncbi:hypothetical protein E4U47_000639 [Claviceps purpurea]|nr:hypothetical protein E4U47_000639 [Claviceps purpurea]